MTDCTNVKLTLAKKSLEKATSLIDDLDGNESEEWVIDGTDIEMLSFNYDDVNYSQLGFEKVLQKNKIPYDKVWGDGDEYEAGEEFLRVDSNGETYICEIKTSTFGLIDFEKVKEAFKQSLDAMKSLISDYETENYVMPWREQVQLITNSGQ